MTRPLINLANRSWFTELARARGTPPHQLDHSQPVGHVGGVQPSRSGEAARIRSVKLVGGQAMIEYLVIASVVLAILFSLRQPIQDAANSVMANVGNHLTAGTAETADGILR